MRLAVISDIHGNAPALAAVLEDIHALGADLTLNLGDHFSGPLDARTTAKMLAELDIPTIRGNHDRWLYETAPEAMISMDATAYRQLAPEHLDWLRSLPETLVVADKVLMTHGTPASDEEGWIDLPDRTRSRDEIEDDAAGADYPVLLCGHSHVPRAIYLSGGRLLVNPGSVGCPGFRFTENGVTYQLETGAPHARYAVLEEKGGKWSVSHRAIPYDFAAAAEMARRNGNAVWANLLSTGWLD